MRTDLCDLLGIELPIIQAPMGSASCPALAAAVSNAGGLGTLALSWTKPDDVRRVIRETRRLTQRPFGINLVLEDHVPEDHQLRQIDRFLDLGDLRVKLKPFYSTIGRPSVDPELIVLDWPQEERLAICLEEHVPVISFFFGDALPLVEQIHSAGALVCVTVGSGEDARAAAAGGVDFVVAQGWEAGGHVAGQVATLPLVRAVVRAVAPTPGPSPLAASPTDRGSPPHSSWAPQAHGLVHGSWRAKKPQFIHAFARCFWHPRRLTRPTPSCSILGGPAGPTGYYATRHWMLGRLPVDPLQANGRARANCLANPRRGARSFAISRPRHRQMQAATLRRSRSLPVRAWVCCATCNLPPTLCVRSPRAQRQPFTD